jgi:hypothetical protein
MRTHPNVKTFEPIACCRSKGHQLWARICDADLEITVRILLFEYNTNSFLHVDEKASRSGDTLLVMRHSSCSHM